MPSPVYCSPFKRGIFHASLNDLRLASAFLAFIVFLCPAIGQCDGQKGQSPLKNSDVVSMLGSGISPEVVVAKIKASTCDFDTSPATLTSLKKAGVPDSVILAMVEAPAAKAAPSNPIPAGMLRSIAWRAVPEVATAENSYTNCTGGGTWSGMEGSGSMSGDMSCTTTSQNIPWKQYRLYNLVETTSSTVELSCKVTWLFNWCHHLVPGVVYKFERRKGMIRVFGHNKKGKIVHVDYDVVSVQAKAAP